MLLGLDPGESDQTCDPLPEESIRIWRGFARQAATMLDLVVDLDRSRLVSEKRWEPLRFLTPKDVTTLIPTTDEDARERWPADTRDQRQRKMVHQQRAYLALYLEQWLLMAGIAPGFVWRPGRRGMDLVGPGDLFAAVAVQLADTASGTTPLSRCDECLRFFTPKRRPDPKTDHFCSLSACKAARKKRYHRRRVAERS